MQNGSVVIHTLKPLSDKKWAAIEKSASDVLPAVECDPTPVVEGESNNSGASKDLDAPASAMSSSTALGQAPNDDTADGIVLDAEREVRVKLHVGRVSLFDLVGISTR